MLSIIILYAEIANVFDFEHNLIYDFFQATSSAEDSPNYFYLSNVRIALFLFYMIIVDVFNSSGILGVCNKLWALLTQDIKHLRFAQEPPIRSTVPPFLWNVIYAHGSSHCIQLPAVNQGIKRGYLQSDGSHAVFVIFRLGLQSLGVPYLLDPYGSHDHL